MTDEPFDIDAWLTGASLPTLDTTVHLDGKAWGRWYQADRKYDRLRRERQGDDAPFEGAVGEVDELAAAKAEVVDAQEALLGSEKKLTVRALSVDELKAADEAATADVAEDADETELFEARILRRLAVAVIEPPLGYDGVVKLRNAIGETQFKFSLISTLGTVLEGGAVDPDVDFLPEPSVMVSTEESSLS